MEVAGRAGLWLGAAGWEGAPQRAEGTLHPPAKARWAGAGCLLLRGIGAHRGQEISPASEELQPSKSRLPGKAVSQPTHGAAAGNHRQTRIPKLKK